MAKKPNPSTTQSTKTLPMFKTPIPGGSANWYKPAEVPVRRQRELDIIGTRLAPVYKRIAQSDSAAALHRSPAEATIVADTPSEDIGDEIIGDSGLTLNEALELTDLLTDEEVRLLWHQNDVAAWAFLKSWTLKKNGEPVPLPADPDEILDLAPALHKALTEHAAKLYNFRDAAASFEVDPGVEDPDSPTGDSDA